MHCESRYFAVVFQIYSHLVFQGVWTWKKGVKLNTKVSKLHLHKPEFKFAHFGFQINPTTPPQSGVQNCFLGFRFDWSLRRTEYRAEAYLTAVFKFIQLKKSIQYLHHSAETMNLTSSTIDTCTSWKASRWTFGIIWIHIKNVST